MVIEIAIGVALGIIAAWYIIKKNLIKKLLESPQFIIQEIVPILIIVIFFWLIAKLYEVNPSSFLQWAFILGLGGTIVGSVLAVDHFFPTEKNWLMILRILLIIILNLVALFIILFILDLAWN